MKNTEFHKPGNTYDEYYTQLAEVEWIFENLNIPVKDKIIYCFCDGEDSAFVKFFKAHKELGYKELIYTSDDYNTHLDLFDKADIYITNPPFSKILKEIIPILNDRPDKEYFLFCSLGNIHFYRRDFVKQPYIYRRKHFQFIVTFTTKDGSNKIEVGQTAYMTTIRQEYYENYKKRKKEEYKPIKWKSETKEGLMIDKLNAIPDDYDGYMLAPITILLDPMYRRYDIVDIFTKEKITVEDGRGRYIRILIKNIKK